MLCKALSSTREWIVCLRIFMRFCFLGSCKTKWQLLFFLALTLHQKIFSFLFPSFSHILPRLPSSPMSPGADIVHLPRELLTETTSTPKKNVKRDCLRTKRKFLLLLFCFSVPIKCSKFSLQREEKTSNLDKKVVPPAQKGR